MNTYKHLILVQLRSHAVYGICGHGELCPAELRAWIRNEIYADHAPGPDRHIELGRIPGGMYPRILFPSLQPDTFRKELPQCKDELEDRGLR